MYADLNLVCVYFLYKQRKKYVNLEELEKSQIFGLNFHMFYNMILRYLFYIRSQHTVHRIKIFSHAIDKNLKL